MKIIIFILLSICITSIIYSQEIEERNFSYYASAKNTLVQYKNKFKECMSSKKIDPVRCGHYGSSSHTLDNYIKRYNQVLSLSRKNRYLSESTTLFAGSTTNIDILVKRFKEAELSKKLNAVDFWSYYAVSNYDIDTFKKRYEEIENAYPELRNYAVWLEYAISDYTLDKFIIRYNEIKGNN